MRKIKGFFTYYWAEPSNRVFWGFTLLCACVGIPLMWGIDTRWGTLPNSTGSWWETARLGLLVLGVLHLGILIYTVVKYRKYKHFNQ